MEVWLSFGGLYGSFLLSGFLPPPYDIPGQRRKKDTPLDILKKRFANGEITEKEYYEKKSIIEYQSPKQPPIL